MWVLEDMRCPTPIMVEMAGLVVVLAVVVLLGGPVLAPSAEDDWLDAMMRAVRVEQANEGPFWGTYEPYRVQLEVVEAHYRRGNTAAVYVEMNRFMDMLERRVNGIPDVTADWLFDYCYAVTPARYHDVSRHIEKFKRHEFGWPIRPVG